MRILAIDNTDLAGSVALLESDRLTVEQPLPAGRRSAQTLAPTISRLLETAGWKATDVQLTAVTTGPGSFTSLRVAVTTVKAFAYATGSEILGVNTLHVIAAQTPPPAAEVAAVLDAQRQQLFAARLARKSQGSVSQHSWSWIDLTHVIDADAWLAGLRPGDVVSGPGLELVVGRLPAGVTAVEAACWTPRAATVGQLAWQAHSAGQRDDVFQLVPTYFRRTAAEEQRDRIDQQRRE